jgi:hypothetical protein
MANSAEPNKRQKFIGSHKKGEKINSVGVKFMKARIGMVSNTFFALWIFQANMLEINFALQHLHFYFPFA